MSMEQALFQIISSISGITTLLPGTPIPIFASVAPPNTTKNFVTFQRIEGQRWRSINGPSGVVQAKMQIDSYAEKYSDTKSIAALIEAALDGFTGVVGYGTDSPQAKIKFLGISCQNDVDIFDQTDQPFMHRVSADYLVTFEQP